MNIFYSLANMDERVGKKISGVCTGIVTNIEDPEHFGRIKVKFPVRVGGDTEYESHWAPLVTWLAGPEMGAFFLPHVDDEVLLAFNDGNLEEPFVIGSLWNGKDKPPVSSDSDRIASKKTKISKLKTHGGTEIIFDDEASKGKLEMHTSKGNKILLDDENQKIEIKDSKGQNMLTINTQSKEITVQSNGTINLKASGCSVKIEATPGAITIESNLDLKLKGQMVTIEAGANMDIKSSGMLNLKGSMVKIN
ncbi:MAG: phage baseplate assembly protein V [Syntrophomonadaceae bacterium]|nr:phage baseplate assembly protein V [Syntrophomonadaceae bacterium]